MLDEQSNPARSALQPRGAHDLGSTPRDLRVKIKEQRLEIDWADGTSGAISLGPLRRVCPCAGCRTEREQQASNPLRILKADPTELRVVSARLVGNYALQLDWSDGHNTGIFDFRFLRTLASGGAGSS